MSASNTQTTSEKMYTVDLFFSFTTPSNQWVEMSNEKATIRAHLTTNWRDQSTKEEIGLIDSLTSNPAADAEMKLTGSACSRFIAWAKKMNALSGWNEKGDKCIAPANAVAPVVAPTVVTPIILHVTGEATSKMVYNAVVNHKTTKRRRRKGTNKFEDGIRHYQAAKERLEDGLIEVEYDIPTEFNTQFRFMYSYLWHNGFRKSKSSWILFKDVEERSWYKELIRMMTEHNCVFWDNNLSKEEHAKFLGWCQRSLDEELRKAHTSLITNIANADQRLQEATKKIEGTVEDTEGQRRNLLDLRYKNVRTVIKTASERLDRSIVCAENFDQTDNVEVLILGLREALRVQTDLFNVNASELGMRIIS